MKVQTQWKPSEWGWILSDEQCGKKLAKTSESENKPTCIPLCGESCKALERKWLQRSLGICGFRGAQFLPKAQAQRKQQQGCHSLQGELGYMTWRDQQMGGSMVSWTLSRQQRGHPNFVVRQKPLELRQNHRKRRNSIFPQPWSNRGLR